MTTTNMKVLWGLILVLLIAAMQSYPSQKASQVPSQGTISVVTLTVLEKHVVEIIGGDKVTVTSILGPSEPPFWFEWTSEDVTAIENADILFAADLDYLVTESYTFVWLPDLLNASDTSDLVQIDLYRNLTMRIDPVLGTINHLLWTDPRNVHIMVEDIADELGRLDPNSQTFFKENQIAYQSQLDSVVTDIMALAAPYNGTKVVTVSSQSWVFLDMIGFEKVGQIVQHSSGLVTPEEIAEIEDLIFEEEIGLLIHDWPGPKLFTPAAVETIIEDTAIASVDFESDVDSTTSYLEIMEGNMERIVETLEEADEKESNGIPGFEWDVASAGVLAVSMLAISQTRKRRFRKNQSKLFE